METKKLKSLRCGREWTPRVFVLGGGSAGYFFVDQPVSEARWIWFDTVKGLWILSGVAKRFWLQDKQLKGDRHEITNRRFAGGKRPIRADDFSAGDAPGDTAWDSCGRLPAAAVAKRICGSDIRVPLYLAVEILRTAVTRERAVKKILRNCNEGNKGKDVPQVA